jgi:2-dehydrotetronate isomerase
MRISDPLIYSRFFMPRFAANLSMMYLEYAFLDRFEAAARDGFKAVEFMFPYEFPASEIRAKLKTHGLTQALFNAPPGKFEAGERGIAALPGREREFHRSIETALAYADVLGTSRLHVMAGIIAESDDVAHHRGKYLDNLAFAAAQAKPLGITIVIEPINVRDMPGYFLNYQNDAHLICEEVGADNLQVQLDLYHCQIMEGDLAMTLKQTMGGVGHIQIAGVPDRHEPDDGEINYPYLFQLIDELGYTGWIGCEYRPRQSTSAGLGWLRQWQ